MIEIITTALIVGIFMLVTTSTYKGMFRQSRIGCSHLIIAPTVRPGKVRCHCGLIKSENNTCAYKTCPIVNAQIV